MDWVAASQLTLELDVETRHTPCVQMIWIRDSASEFRQRHTAVLTEGDGVPLAKDGRRSAIGDRVDVDCSGKDITLTPPENEFPILLKVNVP